MVLSLFVGCEEDNYTTKSSIYGTVIESTDNTPIEGVIVTNQSTGKNCITKADGRYEFPNLEFGKTYKIHIELLARTDLKELINLSRSLNMKILSIERNAAYANSGLSVYTINYKRLEKNEENSHFLQTIKELPYVNYVEELK